MKVLTTAIGPTVQHQLTNGIVFGALMVQAALKSHADALLTLNPKHFTRLGKPIASIVQVPQ